MQEKSRGILRRAGKKLFTPQAVERMLEDHQIYGFYEIPENFSRRIAEGEQVKVGLYADLSSMLYYKALLIGATNVYIEMNRPCRTSSLPHLA